MLIFISKLIMIEDMTIVSISLNEKLLGDIDRIEKELGFSGRSEVVRAGLRMLVQNEKENSKITGIIEGVVIVVNPEKYNEDISKIRHDYSDIIKTQIHNHLDAHKCLQIFVLKGNAEKVKAMIKKLESSKKTEYVKLIAP
jgi:CopG family nickel-responsive transcriptional regulator